MTYPESLFALAWGLVPAFPLEMRQGQDGNLNNVFACNEQVETGQLTR